MFIYRAEIIDKINHFTTCNKPFVFAIDFNGEIGFVLSSEDADKTGIKYYFSGMKTVLNNTLNKTLIFNFFLAILETYKNAFDKVVFHLNRGDTYLTNLTFQTPLQVNLTLNQIFEYICAPFRLLVPGLL